MMRHQVDSLDAFEPFVLSIIVRQISRNLITSLPATIFRGLTKLTYMFDTHLLDILKSKRKIHEMVSNLNVYLLDIVNTKGYSTKG
jgi:hypothetical protein